jgi:hypothetical protein
MPTTITQAQLTANGFIRRSPSTDRVQIWARFQNNAVQDVIWDSSSERWFEATHTNAQDLAKSIGTLVLVVEFLIDSTNLGAGVKNALKAALASTVKAL